MTFLLLFITSFIQPGIYADVIAVQVTGEELNYSFQVTIKSPDKGCEQYADWWELIDNDGGLIYRRILMHSHVSEQPFKRSGGGIRIKGDMNIWIRAHMNNSSYGGQTYYGSVETGFSPRKMDADFAMDIEKEKPQPDDCWN